MKGSSGATEREAAALRMGYEESATLQYASDLSKEANMFGASGLSLADIALMYSHR